MLPTAAEALRSAVPKSVYVFPSATGGMLDIGNIRNRIWYPSIEKAGLRSRYPYQTRHTFASLMLQAGKDPAWIARMMGHTTLKMIFERYGTFFRNRTRQDGALYLK